MALIDGKHLDPIMQIIQIQCGLAQMHSFHFLNTGMEDFSRIEINLLGTHLQYLCCPLHQTFQEKCFRYNRFSHLLVAK